MPRSPLSTAAQPLPAARLRSRLLGGILGIAVGYALLVGLWAWARRAFAGPAAPVSGVEVLVFILATGAALYLGMRWLAGRFWRAHAETARAEALSRERFQALPCPAWVYDLDTLRILDANPAALAFFGVPRQEFLQWTLHSLWPDDRAGTLEALVARVRAGGAEGCVVAHDLRTREGLRHAEIRSSQLLLPSGPARLVVANDLSEPERMRGALAESNAELQAMARRLFSLQEDERRAISRDLHDDIGQAITAMKLSACAAADESDEARRREDLMSVVELADSTVNKLRNLSMLLRPPQLDALGLEAALRWQATMLFRSSQVRLELDIAPLPHRPGNEVEQACFRIAQESLTNAMRHACAGEVTLTLRPQGDQLALQVADDGDGFDPDGPRGLGLIVMRERAQTAGGTLRIDSSPGAGTRVSLLLPYPPAGETLDPDSGR